MSAGWEKPSTKLAGKHLLGFDTRNILADGPDLLRMNSAKVSEPPKTVSAKVGFVKKQSVVKCGIDDQTHS